MKFTVSQSSFATHLAQALRAIPLRSSHAILGHFLLNADKERVSVTGFDLCTAITSTFQAQVQEGGTLAVPARLLSNLVDSLPTQQDLTLQVEGENLLKLSTEQASYQLQGCVASEYPSLPSLDQAQPVTLSVEELLQALKPTLNSYATDEAKQILAGICLRVEKDSLEFASTDAHRLAVSRLSLNTGGQGQLIIPGKSLETLTKLLKETDEKAMLSLHWNDSLIQFSGVGISLTSRLLEGTYPDYPQLIPQSFTISVELLMAALQAATKRLLLLSTKSPVLKLVCSQSQQQVNLTLFQSSTNNGVEAIPATVSTDLTIGFNGKYLLEAIESLSGKELLLSTNLPNTPALLQSLEAKNTSSLVMLMPCQLPNEPIRESSAPVTDLTQPSEPTSSETQKPTNSPKSVAMV